ncbi:MAG: bifunctional 5,10-methylenetetrahydrofolate dehydrogenase/5,10-methenyltetrahydrofolate cyclohydrolase [Deltaproteobacteria bacterium]|jgi:methylenetetrahydrofolate dehydrogenase (NADP+)/methenyltetrahydrofolate cyclohydrolase|nr:bifunctional 5,10-methylenetetrahydrofolate dehydrogenase/5,10-methenyltetrahydrofolate cyclohydrolase [Deltaproteobacteria bacterium]
MTAQILQSKQIVQKLKEEIKAEALALKERGTELKLATILAGGDEPSRAYAMSKKKACESLGISFSLETFPDDVSEDILLNTINSLNADPLVTGIMLELPLPKTIDPVRVSAAIKPEKDVDGVTPVNRGLLLLGRLEESLLPVTPQSCVALIDSTGTDLKGKDVALIGRGETVGLPLMVLLIKRSATVTVCHSKTKDLTEKVKKADIVVTATGQKGLVKKDMLSPGQIVIDAGITVLPDGKIVGDVEKGAAEVVSHISPVPGGVGSLTVVLLLKNLIKGAKLQKK